MLLRLLLLFIALPFVELILLLVLAHYTSIWFTLATVIATGLAGTLLARAQGLMTIRAIQREVAQGHMPTAALLDGVLILCAGALLLTPGLLTDAIGLATLVPWFRNRLRTRLVRWIRRRFRVVPAPESTADGDTHEPRVLDIRIVDPKDPP